MPSGLPSTASSRQSSSPHPSGPWALFALALPLAGLNAGLALLALLPLITGLAHRIPLTLSLLGLGFLYLIVVAPRLERAASPGRAILLGGLLLRLPLVLLPLTLSEDALRYLWDGKVALAGFNPYALPPAAPELAPLRDETWQALPHTEVATVYPPLAVAVSSIASRLPLPLLSWKLLLTAVDLGTCALLLGLARRRGIPEGRVVWYAWNPLVALEVSGMGHLDILGVAAVVGVAFALARRPAARRTVSGAAVWAAAGALAKLVPLAALPMWARQSGRPVRFLAGAGILIAAALAPVVLSTGGIPPGLRAYGISWEFNGPVFEPLWRLLAQVDAAPRLARGLEALERRTEMWYAWDWIYPYLYPQLLAKLLLAAGMAIVVLRSLKESDPLAGAGRLFGRLLLLSATVYPWYLLWVLPWAALAKHRAWLALSAIILLSYLVLANVPVWPWLYLAIWVPFGALLLTSPPGPLSHRTPARPGEGGRC